MGSKVKHYPKKYNNRIVYLCNLTYNARSKKITAMKGRVTCKNCIRELKRLEMENNKKKLIKGYEVLQKLKDWLIESPKILKAEEKDYSDHGFSGLAQECRIKRFAIPWFRDKIKKLEAKK